MLLGEQIGEDKFWRHASCSREREKKCIPGNLKERDYVEGLDIDGKTNILIDLKDIKKMADGGLISLWIGEQICLLWGTDINLQV